MNINSTCWQYSMCNTPWELFRFIIVIFSIAVLVKAFGVFTTYFVAWARTPSRSDTHSVTSMPRQPASRSAAENGIGPVIP